MPITPRVSKSMGQIRACLEESVEYAKHRVAFERPISDDQLIKAKAAEMVVGLEYRSAVSEEVLGRPVSSKNNEVFIAQGLSLCFLSAGGLHDHIEYASADAVKAL